MVNGPKVCRAAHEHQKPLFVAPIAVALLTGALLLAFLFVMASKRTDAVSFERQRQLVNQVVEESIDSLVEQQESVTLKDNAVLFFSRGGVRTEEDRRRLDGNMGPFLHTYYGHDESYLLDPEDAAFYAMRDGEVVPADTFAAIRETAAPLIAELRAKMRGVPADADLSGGSPGVYDITVLRGHPAIVSIKPIVSPTGAVPQPRGGEHLQISVLRLDRGFLANMDDGYMFAQARFAWTDQAGGEEASIPFVSPRTGETVGYLVWRPFRPGSAVLTDMALPMLIALLLVGSVVAWLIRRLSLSTTELKVSEAQARYLAAHDSLTGLTNRSLFDDKLDRALADARDRLADQPILLFLDLDRFKHINDSLGHAAGDEVIREVARRLQEIAGPRDTVARLGGDEFAIIARDLDTPDKIHGYCEQILKSIKEPFKVVGSRVFVGMSIGVARPELDGYERKELCRKADIALYRVKNLGRDNFALFTDDMDDFVQTRQWIEADLREALRSGDQLELNYQPQFDAASGEIVGLEALVRWRHPERGSMSPSIFIPVAEETGLIEPLGRWVLEEACRAGARWNVASMAVNVSGRQLRKPGFAEEVFGILRETGLDPSRLELEITETSFVENIAACRTNIHKMRSAGIHIALDDFGTGYSSLSHLRSFKVDRIKIDRSYVTGINGEARDDAIIQAIITLARASGLQITAEGVENESQLEFLRASGCDELQGFLFAKPMAAGEIEQLLSKHDPFGERGESRAA